MNNILLAQAYNKRFKENQRSSKSIDVGEKLRNFDRDYWVSQFDDPTFSLFASQAYSEPGGYALRTNPISGRKEMFVAGTRNKEQWGLNILDSVLYKADDNISNLRNSFTPWNMHPRRVKLFSKLDIPRAVAERKFEKIARENGVEVIYGHSRGGALVSDMDTDAVKVGLDSAMLIASNKDMVNFYEGGTLNPTGWFDDVIGSTGSKNIHLDRSKWDPHKVWKT